MLVLSRTTDNDEYIQIQVEDIVIKVHAVKVEAHNRVRIGIDAPPHVKILRSEFVENKPKKKIKPLPAPKKCHYLNPQRKRRQR
jgi:carbon storage regulator CsrA